MPSESNDQQREPVPVVVDLLTLSANFPLPPTPELIRENVVNSIGSLLNDAVYVAAVEGPEGAGKTTILAQFARRYANFAVSTFVSSANRLSSDADLIRLDVANQVYFAVTRNVLPRDKFEPALLKSAYANMQRIAKRRKCTFYFIIDGLEELENNIREPLLQQLGDIFPIGVPQFRFLFSGDAALYASLFSPKLPIKSFPLTEISLEETKLLFSSYNLTSEQLRDLYALCGGVPGRLSSVLRAAQAGLDLLAFLQDPPSHKPDFFQIEWNQVSEEDDLLRRILALLVHDARPRTVADIAEILDTPAEGIEKRIGSVTFVSIDPLTSHIRLANGALRRFIATRLADRKVGVQKMLIKHLLKSPKSDDAILQLPEYLEEAAQFQDVVSLLTPAHILEVLEPSRTPGRVEDAVHRGFRSAERLGRDPDLLRFGIQHAVIAELATSNVWESEVGALASLGRDAEALALANNALLKEDRLQLLAVLAHSIWLRGQPVGSELVDQIRLLIDTLDARTLGRRAQRIASQLTCVSPDLATLLLSKSQAAPGPDNDLERAFAHLTVSAIYDQKDERRRAEALDNITVSSQDPKTKALLQTFQVLAIKLTAADVCVRVDEITDINTKILVLRCWCVLNGSGVDGDLVARHALTIALRNTSTTLDSSLLADISAALSGIMDSDRAKGLIDALDGVRGTAERLGPSVDYVRLQLSIAAAEFKFDQDAAEGRLMELIDYVARVTDLPSKAEAYAHFLATLQGLHAGRGFKSGDLLAKQCADELETAVLQLALSTADHYLALNGVITALANGYLEKALEYTRIVNTELRRDTILVEIVQSLVHRPVAEIQPGALAEALSKIKRSADRDQATRIIMERLADAVEIPAPVIDGLLPLISSLPALQDSIVACRSMVCAVNLLSRHPTAQRNSIQEDIRNQIHARWAKIDIGWRRIDTGFLISKDLALTFPEDAQRMLKETEDLKDELRFTSQRPAAAYVVCIGLVIRAFCGLLPKRLESDTDIKALSALIDILPTYGERAVLWADLCMRSSIVGRGDLTERLGKEFLQPSLTHIPIEDRAYRSRVLVQVAPALFKLQPTTCLETLDTLEPDDRDSAVRAIVRFLIFARVPSDPSEGSDTPSQEITWEILRTVTDLLEHLETDWMIYVTAKDIADAMESTKNRYPINIPQREDIGRRIEAAARKKLPIKRQIVHNGYQIATLAESFRMRKAKPAEWSTLIDEAQQIENIADRALVMQIVALCLPTSMEAQRTRVLGQVRAAIEMIPSDLDKFDHYLSLAEDLRGIDSVQCRELVNVATSVLTRSSEDVATYQRRLVDLAYRIDQNLAKGLIDRFDDDKAKRAAQAQMRLLDVRKNLGVDQDATKALQQVRARDLSRLGWSLVRALSAGRFQNFHPSDIRSY